MFLGSRARPVRRADSLTAVCVPIVWTMRDQHLTTLLASTAWYVNSFHSYIRSVGLLGRGIRPSQSLYLHPGHKHNKRIGIHASSGI
jgi:hypothetical protein